MKFKDLDTTTVYAYQPRFGPAQKILVLDTEKFYTSTGRWRGNEIIPARPNQKATTGSGYDGVPVGVLVCPAEDPTARQLIAYPAHILGPWDEAQKKKEAEEEQRRKDRQREKDFRDQNALDAQRAKELMSQHPEIFPGTVYVDSYNPTQKITTTQLIELLEALPQLSEASHV
jgi:hypothetical protein